MTDRQGVRDACTAIVKSALLNADTHTITVDGTSCAKKTSVLAATGRPVTKVQLQFNAKNADTFGASMVGYVCAGMTTQSLDPRPKFNDRSPLNVLEWHLLWKLMDTYVQRFGNRKPDTSVPGVTDFLQEFVGTFETLKSWYVYAYFRSRINGVAFIDTNVERCDRLRAIRNEGSDVERSLWLFYTPLQNLMYQVLYPDALIDMIWFDSCATDEVVAGLADFMNDLLATVSARPSVDRRAIPINLAPPVVTVHGRDFNEHNIGEHVYRSIGRTGVKRILRPGSATFDLSACTPDYLTVDEVTGPDGETWCKVARHTDCSRAVRLEKRRMSRRRMVRDERDEEEDEGEEEEEVVSRKRTMRVCK